MENNGSPVVALFAVMYVGVIIFILASMWRVYTKAGHPGWSALIPIYNTYILLKIAGQPGWWLVLFLIPFVNIVIEIIVLVGVANNFGKSGGFAVGLLFLPFVFFPILAFGDAKYTGHPGDMAAAQP